MKKVLLRKAISTTVSLAMIVTLLFIPATTTAGATTTTKAKYIRLINDEIDTTSGQFSSISTDMAKTGTHSIKADNTYADFWLVRCTFPSFLGRSYDVASVTSNGTAGALRFWIYVPDYSDVANWGSGQVQLGAWWDSNVKSWNNWQTQITQSGWNEVILPISDAAQIGTFYINTINYVSIRIGNVSHKITVYIDDLMLTDSTAPSSNYTLTQTYKMITDCDTALAGSYGGSLSNAYVKQGLYSLQQTDNDRTWLIRPDSTANINLNLSAYSANGGIHFWVYVDDYTALNDAFLRISSIASGYWDDNIGYRWSFKGQITKNGWNEVVLPFYSVSDTSNGRDSSALKYLYVRIPSNYVSGTVNTVNKIFVDSIKAVSNPEAVGSTYNFDEPSYTMINNFDLAGATEHLIEGTASVKFPGTDQVYFPANPVDISSYVATGGIRFMLYVTNYTTFAINGQLEVCSSWSDWEEIHWGGSYIAMQVKKNGWNEIYLPFSLCGFTSGADGSGNYPINYTSVKYIRLYGQNQTVWMDSMIAVPSYGDEFAKAQISTENALLEPPAISGVTDQSVYYSGSGALTVTYDQGTATLNGEAFTSGTSIPVQTAAYTLIVTNSLGTTKTVHFTYVVKGDVSGNGEINTLDLILIKNHMLGITPVANPYSLAADYDGSGGIDIRDLLTVKDIVVATAGNEATWNNTEW